MTAREHSYTCGEIVVNKYLEALQGLNLVALRRGFEEGPRALDRASRVAYIAARAAATHQQVLTSTGERNPGRAFDPSARR